MDDSQLVQWDVIINEIKENDGSGQERYISTLIEIITDNVYKEGTYDCLDYFRERLEDIEGWQEIEHKVYTETNFYIKTIGLREVPEDKVVEEMQLLYGYFYHQLESEDYVCSETGFSEKLIKAMKWIFAYCEQAVLFRRISKRRFCSYVADYGKFSELFIEKLWDLFYNADDTVKKCIFMRHFFDLEVKVNYLLRGQDEMEEEINFLEYLLMDNSSDDEL